MQSSYNLESEKVISDLLLKEGWASAVHWDRNDWYIEWSDKAKKNLDRIPAILTYWYNSTPAHLKCVDFMTRYFGLNNANQDRISVNMQEAIIGEAQKKLQAELPEQLIDKIRNGGWSYTGLEMILDTVKTLEREALANYLQKL